MKEFNYWTHGRRVSRRAALRAGGVAGIGLAGAALIGCGDDDEEPPAATPTSGGGGGGATATATTAAPTETQAAGGPRQGGTLSTHGPVPGTDTRDVIVGTWEGHRYAGEHVYDRLISARTDERIFVLEAAESMETPDELTVVAKLQPGLVYQDLPPVNGRPVVAQDIVEMQERAKNEDQAHNRAFQTNILDFAEATDDQTVVFHLQRPSAYLFSVEMLGYAGNMCIVPAELSTGDFGTMPPVGSGPYMESDVHLQVRYEYTRNPTYRRASENLPYIDQRIVIPLVDNAAIEAALRGGESMVWGQQGGAVPWDIADNIIADMGDQLEVTEYLSLSPYTLNVSGKRPEYADIRVREAFQRAFQPEPFIDLNLSGKGVPVPGVIPASLEPYQVAWEDELPSGRTIQEAKAHDMEAARSLLDAAGFDMGRQIQMSTIASPVNDTALQIWEQTLRELGFTGFSYEKVLPFGEWVQAASQTGDYDFVATGHPGENIPARMLRLHHTTTGQIHQSFNIADPEIDAMIEASETELEPEAHYELVKEAQRALIDQHAHMWYVYTAEAVHLAHAVIKDWEFNPGLMIMHRPEAWLDT